MTVDMNEQGYWEDEWTQRLAGYLSATPRAGLWLYRHFGKHISSVLEIGAGSCRDSVFLSEAGYECTASDFSARTMTRLADHFASSRLRFSIDDARSLSFADGEFELVFHNGLIVCFDADVDVIRIIREQRRVASRYMVIIAHNGENSGLVQQFSELGRTESLYRIRFFTRPQLAALVQDAAIDYERMRFMKFGGPADAFYGERIRGIRNPLQHSAAGFVPALYGLQPWHRTERIALILTV